MHFVVFAAQIRFSHCRSWWTAGFQEHWTLSFRLCFCVPCCSSGSVSIMASGFRWVHACTFTLMAPPLFPFLVHFLCGLCVYSSSHRARGNALHFTCQSWSLLVFCGSQQLHWAYGKRKLDLTDLRDQTYMYNMWVRNVLKDVLYFSKCTGLMNSKTLPINIKWT